MPVSLISCLLLPSNYVLNGEGQNITINEDDYLNEDCLNPMMSNEFVTSGMMQHFDTS